MSASRALTAASVLAAAAIFMPSDSQARLADDPFAKLDAIGRADLGDLRGGMMINGIPVNFAIMIRTTVEGALAANGLQTTLTVNDAGGLAGMTTTALGTDLPVAAGAGAGAGAGEGMSMTLNGGETAIMHQVLNGQIQALIANTMDEVTISHQTQINVTMPGFNEMTRTYSSLRQISSLGRDAVMVGLGRF